MEDTCVYKTNKKCRHSKKEEADRSSFFTVEEGYAHIASVTLVTKTVGFRRPGFG